jgi:hypothetical protein
VFTNALDHAFDLGRICREVSRVLKPQGIFLAEIVAGSRDPDGRGPGKFEALWWESLERVAEQIVGHPLPESNRPMRREGRFYCVIDLNPARRHGC